MSLGRRFCHFVSTLRTGGYCQRRLNVEIGPRAHSHRNELTATTEQPCGVRQTLRVGQRTGRFTSVSTDRARLPCCDFAIIYEFSTRPVFTHISQIFTAAAPKVHCLWFLLPVGAHLNCLVIKSTSTPDPHSDHRIDASSRFHHLGLELSLKF